MTHGENPGLITFAVHGEPWLLVLCGPDAIASPAVPYHVDPDRRLLCVAAGPDPFSVAASVAAGIVSAAELNRTRPALLPSELRAGNLALAGIMPPDRRRLAETHVMQAAMRMFLSAAESRRMHYMRVWDEEELAAAMLFARGMTSRV